MRRAFTLIEVIVVIAISAVITLATVQFYIVYGRVIISQKSAIEVALGGSNIIDAVRSAGLPASHIVASHVFAGTTYNTGATTAIFEIPAADNAGAVILGAYDYVCIYALGSIVYRLTDASLGSARTSGQNQLTNVLGELRFTYDAADYTLAKSVVVSATTSLITRGEPTQAYFHEHVFLRNI